MLSMRPIMPFHICTLAWQLSSWVIARHLGPGGGVSQFLQKIIKTRAFLQGVFIRVLLLFANKEDWPFNSHEWPRQCGFRLKKPFFNSSFLWWHEGDKNKFYTLVILSLYKIPVTREPSRWPTSLKNSQSIHPPPPHPKQNFWSSQNWYDNRTRICWDWLYYSVMFEYKRCIL